MIIEQCYPFNLSLLSHFAFDCFALSSNTPKLFGFSELISGLALALVVWTITDLRYKFRIETAVFPIKKASIVTIILLGVLTLLTDYWRASQSRVPLGAFFTPESWQLLLGGVFFMILIVWFWFAFLKPTKFSSLNAKKFSLSIERYLLRGSTSELVIIGDELTRSIPIIIRYAQIPIEDGPNIQIPNSHLSAHKVLMAIASPKFSKAIVEGAPRLIIHLFNSVNEQKYYDDEIKIIAKNILSFAILNPNSFLYNEDDLYNSGLEGITRPVITALYQNAELIKQIDTLFDLKKRTLDSDQWNAYCRLILTVFTVHANGDTDQKPSCLHWAYLNLQTLYSDLTKGLQLTDLKLGDDLYERLRILGNLIKDMVSALDDQEIKNKAYFEQAVNDISEIILSLIKAASSVRKPRRVSITIQKKLIWEEILHSIWLTDTGLGQKVIEKVHHKLLNVISEKTNLDSVTLLGYCINVMLPPNEQPKKDGYGQSWYSFYVDFTNWLINNIDELFEKAPNIDQKYFVEGISYDKKNNQLVFHYPKEDGSEEIYKYFKVNPIATDSDINENSISADDHKVNSLKNTFESLLSHLKRPFN